MALEKDPSTMSSQSLRSIADNPNHPLHTHAKAELSRRTQREEKTLTPAEIRKRDKIAKAIKKDNPNMPMDKKMAIATATAKRVAESKSFKKLREGKAYGPTGVSYHVPSGHKDEVNPKTGEKYPERQKPGYKNPSEQKVDEISSNKLGDYMKKSAADVSKSRGDVRRQDKRIGGQKMADDKIRKKMGYSSQAKVPAGTNEATDDDYHKTLGPTKNSDEGIAALKKKHGMSHTKAVATMKRLMGEGKVDEISIDKLSKYGKAAAKDIEQKRNKVKAALDQPASVKHAKDGMKAMQGLTKRSKGSDMYVNKMTGRSKVKPTAESTLARIKKILDR